MGVGELGNGWVAGLFRELVGTGKFPGLTLEVVALGVRAVEGHPAWRRVREQAMGDLVVEARGVVGNIGSAVPWIAKRLTERVEILAGGCGGNQKKERGGVGRGGPLTPAAGAGECDRYVPMGERE